MEKKRIKFLSCGVDAAGTVILTVTLVSGSAPHPHPTHPSTHHPPALTRGNNNLATMSSTWGAWSAGWKLSAHVKAIVPSGLGALQERFVNIMIPATFM